MDVVVYTSEPEAISAKDVAVALTGDFFYVASVTVIDRSSDSIADRWGDVA